MPYVDVTYYTNTFKGSKITTAAFEKYERKAENMLNLETFGRIDITSDYFTNVKMCVCEIAEELYTADQAKSSNGMIVKSYGNDGETGTFDESSMTDKSINDRISSITKEWLLSTGILYRGCN